MKDENTHIYLYFAIGSLVLAATALGLSFTILGVYSLIASVLFELLSLSFLATQKKKCNLKCILYLTIAAYALLAASAALFIGGLVFSAMQK